MALQTRCRTRAPSARFAALIVAAALVAGCASQPGSQVPSGSGPVASTAPRGGTLLVVMPPGSGPREQGPNFLDPHLGPGWGWADWELWRCCLARTLYSHNGRPTEEGGSRVLPDLASALPEVSADGLTWTIRLKHGLHYGPPLAAVEITARDFIRSLHRLLAPAISNAGWAAWDFMDIGGAPEYQSGAAASITGLEAPDDHTLVIRLARPKGDLAALLAEPAAAPLPPDPIDPQAAFGIAQGADTGFGRYLVSSGPYMLEGSERLDLSVPAGQRASAAGIATDGLALVRNPSWDPATDTLRPAHADRIEIALVDSVEQAVARLDAGTADLLWPAAGTSPALLADAFAAFQAHPARGHVYLNDSGSVRYVVLNVATPPFDDIHVRKALNLAIDKQHLVDLQGGSVGAQVQGHLLPDYLEDDLLLDYDPYTTPGHMGDLDAARAEMSRSRYDSDGDGRCDAPACEHVRAVTRDQFTAVAASITDDLSPLGIDLEPEVLDADAFFGIAQRPEDKTPALIGMGFHDDYIGGARFLLDFDGRLSIDATSYNLTMVGATREQLRGWGYEVAEVPNVDDRVAACVPLVGAAQFECIASADQYLMENVVPWVPLTQDRFVAIAGARVVRYGFDELTGMSALDQIALEP